MDLKNLLGKLDQLNEAEMTSRKIAGKAYGGAAQHDDEEEDEDGEKKPAAPAVKRGRGRPRKAGGEAQTKAGYGGAAELQKWIVGSVPKKPSKELSKLPATKHKLSDKEPEKKKVKESLKDWIAELDQLMEAEQLTIEPAKASTQVIKQGSKVLGQVSNPQLAATIKQAIGKGEMSLAGTQMREEALDEKWGEPTKVSPEEKGKYAGKSAAELRKAYNKLKASGPHKKGTPEFGRMRELAFAIRAKTGWGKVEEADIYSDGMNSMGAGLGAGRSQATFESKKGVMEGMDPEQKARLYDLIDEYRRATDPEGDDYESGRDPEEILSDVKQEFGDKIANDLESGTDKMHFPRPGHSMGYDPMSWRRPVDRLTKAGKMYKQDSDYRKNTIKSRYNLSGKSVTEGEGVGEVDPIKVGDKVKINSPKDLDWHGREGKVISVMDNQAVVKLQDTGGKLMVSMTELEKQGVVEGSERKDMTGQTCEKCKKDKYEERSQHDDMEGKVTCSCGHRVNRWKNYKEQGAAAGKSAVKRDDKAEKAGKKVAKDIEYDEKVKDKIHGKKRHSEDEKAEKAGKKVAKDIEYDEKKSKKKVAEGMDQRMKAAHHRGKAHALAKEGYNCRYDEGSEEARMYHEGYKMGLDECYGIMPMRGVVVGEEGMDEGMMGAALGGVAGAALGRTPSAAMTGARLGSAVQDQLAKEDMDQDTVDDMASFGAHHDDGVEEGNAFTAALAKTPKGGKFSVGGKTFTDKTDYDAKVDEMMMAFESWDKQLGELLTEGEQVDEGMSIAVSKGQQGLPDSVSVTASDTEADKLMALVKQLGVFGSEESHSDYGAPKAADSQMHGDIEVVDDHDGMLALMKTMSGGQGHDDYADEEGHGEEEVCDACGSAECGCDSEEQQMVDEVESEDQMTYVNLEETNPPDSGAAEVDAEDASVAAQNAAGAAYNPSDDIDEGADGGEASEEPEEGMAEGDEKEESLDEAYANGADDTFNADIAFMTKIISGGLNKQKSTGQTTVPVIAGQSSRMGVDGMNESNDSIADWKKLSGIK